MRVIGEGELSVAVVALEAGAVIAVPTDTVYGLAARLTPAGVESLFALKGRPAELALPVIVGSIEGARTVAAAWPAERRDAGRAVLARRADPGGPGPSGHRLVGGERR